MKIMDIIPLKQDFLMSKSNTNMKTKTYLKIRILHYLMKIRTTKGGQG